MIDYVIAIAAAVMMASTFIWLYVQNKRRNKSYKAYVKNRQAIAAEGVTK